MNHRFSRAALLSLLVCLLTAAPVLAQAREASAAPSSNDAVPPITVQLAPPPLPMAAMFGVANPLGAQPAMGKPLAAEFVTEHRQSFVDGNHIARSTNSSIYRDSVGRIRRESQLSVPGLAAGVSTSSFVNIFDRQLGYGYVLDPQEMVAHRYQLDGPSPSYVAHLNAQGSGNSLLAAPASTDGASPAQTSSESRWHLHAFSHRPLHSNAPPPPQGNGAPLASGFLSDDPGPGGPPPMRIDQPFLAAPNPVRTENLGEQTILGFRCTGSRVITILPAGQIGNDRPINIVSEQWFSPELQLVMRSLHRDPWAGEFTTTVTKVSRGDQPASLFQVPEHYKVIDAEAEREHHLLDGHGDGHPGPMPW